MLRTLFLQSTKNPDLQRKRVLQELGSMMRVQHHPHAVRLLDAFEDARGYHLVMPVLKGETDRTLQCRLHHSSHVVRPRFLTYGTQEKDRFACRESMFVQPV